MVLSYGSIPSEAESAPYPRCSQALDMIVDCIIKVMSRVAEMWYDNRARYEQMARWIAKRQLFCGRED